MEQLNQALALPGNFQPQIILDGSNTIWTLPINAIWIRADFCQIYGLEITDFPDDGIDIYNSDFVTIGDIDKGNVIRNNGIAQDFFSGAPGTGPWEGCGIILRQGSSNCAIKGNVLGTNYNESIVSPNEFCGIRIRNGGDNNIVGGTTAGEGNIIANHPTGIQIQANSFGCSILQNSFYCNDTMAIDLLSNANNTLTPPIVNTVSANSIAGQTNLGDIAVEVYISDNGNCTNAPCQGRTYLGTATPVNGNWTLAAPFTNGVTLSSGTNITALGFDGAGNSSEFAICETFILCAINTTTANQSDATCGQGNGSFTLSVAGGVGPYGFNIGNGNVSNPTFSNLAAGTYTVTITDVFNCNDTETVMIGDTGSPTLSIPSMTNATCDQANGSITASAIGGAGPYSYSISPLSPSGPVFNGLIGGTYTITVTDNNFCTATQSVTLTTTPAPTMSVNNILGATCDQANGALTIVGAGGTPPYNYTLNGTLSSNSNFSNLVGGTYTVGVSDFNGCTINQTITITNTPAVTLSFTAISSATCDQADGSFTANPSGGVSPYEYTLGQNTTSNPIFTGLSGGSYSVTIEDGNGCTAIESVTIANTPAPFIAVSNVSSASCGEANGTVTVAAAAGTPPYQYNIGQGLVSSPIFSGLSSGIYTVSVVDNNGCTASLTAIIGDTPIPSLELVNTINPTCDQANGSVLYQGTGGTPPYQYSINGTLGLNPAFSNLSAGLYNVTIVDFMGCTAVESVELFDPGAPMVVIEGTVDETCEEANGAISFQVNGGIGPYTFDLGNGPGSLTNFTGLRAGNYSVTVIDDNGCTSSITGTILNVGELTTAGYTYIDDMGTVDFMNVSTNGQTYTWDFGDGNTSVLADPNHTYATTGDYTVCLTSTNICGDNTYCELVSVVLPLSDVSISGNIAIENEINVAGVSVLCTGEAPYITIGDGEYEFNNLANGGTYTIEPHKDYNYNNGINILDLYLFQQHYLLVNPFTSPYQVIAADVDNSGSINVLDLVYIQELILLEVDTFPNNESWRFVPKTHIFSTPLEPLTTTYPESITLTNLTADSIDQDFIAVKIGDVNQSANPLLTPQLPLELHPDFVVQDRSASAGELITIDFRSNNFDQLVGYQFDLSFDINSLEFMDIIPGALENLTVANFGQSNIEEGELRHVWYDIQQTIAGISLDSEEVLFSIQFLVKEDFSKLSELLSFNENSLLPPTAYDRMEQSLGVDLLFLEVTTSIENQFDNYAVRVFPNPFSSKVIIEFSLQESKNVTFSLFDVTGKLITEEQKYFSTGRQQLIVKGQDLPAAGIYFYELWIDGVKESGRIVFQP